VTDHLDDFFADYRAGLTPEILPAGPGAVRATVRRRRRIATTAAVVTAIVLVAAPVAGYAAFNNGAGPAPAPGGSSTPTPGESTPPPTPTPSPSASVTTAAPPDGRLSRAQLLAATVDLPPWQRNAPSSCKREDVRLAGEEVSSGPWLMDLVYGDADGDGVQESIATIGCAPGEVDMQQVVVFDRDTGGRTIALAQVVRTEEDVLEWIIKVTPTGEGVLKVRVGDLQPCCDMTDKQVQKQDRTYTWSAGAFKQTGGPTEFPERPDFRTDLKVTASDLVFAGGDYPSGLMTVTLRNAGPRDAINMQISFDFAGVELYRVGPGWGSCRTTHPEGEGKSAFMNCVLKDPLTAGETREIRFHFSAATVPEGLTGSVDVANFDAGAMGDLNQEDNRATFDLRR
jgi:hypothetical protein